MLELTNDASSEELLGANILAAMRDFQASRYDYRDLSLFVLNGKEKANKPAVYIPELAADLTSVQVFDHERTLLLCEW